MRSPLYRLFIPLLLVAIALFASAKGATAREVTLETDALQVENVDGEQVMLLPAFTAHSDEYVLSGDTGRFSRKTELMEATASPKRKASLEKSGEGGFKVTAQRKIEIRFNDERLLAEGAVVYHSADIEASCDTLIADTQEVVKSAVDDLIKQVDRGAIQEMVTAFFAGLSPDERLILLKGNVTVKRNDSTMSAAWMVAKESQQDEFLSVADQTRKLQLKLVMDDNQESPGNQ